MKRNIIHVLLSAIGMSLGLVATAAVAGTLPIVLQDGNSEVTIDPASGTGGPAGVNNWTVNGVNQLQQQWFWYRTGSGTGTASPLDALGDLVVSSTSSNGATLDYSNSALNIQVTFGLIGGTPLDGHSDLSETIKILNTSSSPLPLSFFQYSNFVLQGNSEGENVAFAGLPDPNTVTQTAGNGSLTETVVNSQPEYYEANSYPNTLNSFGSSTFTNLLDLPSAGPGNVTWAFQWNQTIPAGQSFIISKDLQVNAVPEPSSLVLIGVGAIGLMGWVGRRRARANPRTRPAPGCGRAAAACGRPWPRFDGCVRGSP